MLRQLLGTIALMSMVASSFAQPATYTYTGNNFDDFIGTTWDTSDSVTLTITFAPPPVSVTNQILAPTDYTFSDGVNTFTPSSPNGGIQARITTDAGGNITAWEIGWGEDLDNVLNATANSAFTSNAFDVADITQCNNPDPGGAVCGSSATIEGGRVTSPGSWSAPVLPPAASTQSIPALPLGGLIVLALGLAWFGGRKLRS